jgi:hypothetical protein
LLRLDPAVDVGDLATAAARRKVPMTVFDVHSVDAPELYPQSYCSRVPTSTSHGVATGHRSIPSN